MAEHREDSQLDSASQPSRLFYVGWVLAVIAVTALTAGLVMAREFWIGRQTNDLKQAAAQGRRVLVIRAMRSADRRTIELPASTRGYIETPVYAKVAGYLKAIKVDKGDRVRRGQVIALLESPELDQEVADARAKYEIAQLTDRRNQRLRIEQVISQQTADESKSAMLSAQAALRQFEAMRAYKTITAPFDGIVTARYVDQGALVPQTTTPAAGAMPVIAMATLKPMRVYADVPQSLAPFLHNGDPAIVTVAEFPQQDFNGKVTRHPEALNAATRTMLVEVDLPNDDLTLYPGMYAKVAFTVGMPVGVPMVPDDALVFHNGKVYVPVVRDNRMRLSEVTLGYDDGQTVEIRKGVAAGDLVAINAGQAARDGEPVQPILRQPGSGS
ncbi:MAG: efflux RND transporter periplasmic adaptor subunit [Candidatus Binataceae bacterium]|nr:efflux RND transporter periplasmic adaptor subunit [Candidatus Binataceae bacterium]